ncbi:BMP family protein [Polaromonas sp.]|uniref:BMP family protein n=1 Tax=Polaromonas sp. TaxID=1869339 RepID=UPI00286B16C9|nr:BMP family protein [Polaromonas sp.]
MNNNHLSDPTRRRFASGLAALSVAPFLASCSTATPSARPLRVGALFAGQVDDRGFMEAGWRGLERARTELGVTTTYIDGIQPRKELLAAALVKLAEAAPDLVVAHGGQNNEACVEVATRFPSVRFVVTQGAVTSANMASYDVLQEESAYLGGVLAALTTRTGVVGHMSGIRVRPGLKGRAAYAAGVRDTNPNVKLLTNFSGNQDDNALSRRIASAQIANGADVIFTMLNAGRNGVTEACREKGTRQIGNVVDWVQTDSRVFVGSAIADVGIGVFEAVRDLRQQSFPAGAIRKVGLANPQAVRLSLAADVSAEVRSRIARVSADISSGLIKMTETYEGPEFTTPA